MTSNPRDNERLQEQAVDTEFAEFLWKELNADIGKALKKARATRKMLQTHVASLMGVQASRISQIESTKGISMTLDVLARYVAALGYRLDVDIIDPETDDLVSSLPVVPMSFMHVEEAEKRARIVEADLLVSIDAAEPFARDRIEPSTPVTLTGEHGWSAPENRGDSDYLAAA